MNIFPGIITRNSPYDLHCDNSRKKLCDALAVSSIVTNCTGVDNSHQKCLGLQEFKEFLEEFQDEFKEDKEIMKLMHVSNVANHCKVGPDNF